MIPAVNKRTAYRGADYGLVQSFFEKTSGTKQPLDLTTYQEIIWRGYSLKGDEVFKKSLSEGTISITGADNNIISAELDETETEAMGHNYYVYEIYFKLGDGDYVYEKGKLYMGDSHQDAPSVHTFTGVTIDQETEEVTLSDSGAYVTQAEAIKQATQGLKDDVGQLKTDVENIQTDVTNKQQDVAQKAQQVSDDKDAVDSDRQAVQGLRDETESFRDQAQTAADINSRSSLFNLPVTATIGYQDADGDFQSITPMQLARWVQDVSSWQLSPIELSWDQDSGTVNINVQTI